MWWAKWAKRKERNILVEASAEEGRWPGDLADVDPRSGGCQPGGPSFPWTLVKPTCLASGTRGVHRVRLHTLQKTEAASTREIDNLKYLRELNEKTTAENSNKFSALVDYLMDMGVSRRSNRRVVIFSERVPTLHWLKGNLEKNLKLRPMP